MIYDIQNKLLINHLSKCGIHVYKIIILVLNSKDLKMLKKARFARPLAKIEVCFQF